MKKVKIGLIGCGGMAGFYRNVYTQIPGAKLDFVVGLEADEPEKVANELGAAHWSTNFEDCLSSDVDIVDISTPNHFHKEQFLKAAQAGKHILLQKPIAPELSDAKAILDCAQANDVISGVFMSKRGLPAYYIIKKLIKNGFIGKVGSAYARSAVLRKAEADINKNWRNSIEKTGGGALLQLGIHDYNMLSWIFDEKIISVSARCENIMSPHIGGEDTAQTIVTFESGISAVVESSYCSSAAFMSIYGNCGYIEYRDGMLTLFSKNTYVDDDIIYDTENTTRRYEMMCDNKRVYSRENPNEQHIAFVKSVMENKSVPVSIEEGFISLAIVKAAYEASKCGKTVIISDFLEKEGYCEKNKNRGLCK